MAETLIYPKNISCRADGVVLADGTPVDATSMEFCLKMMDCYHLTPQRMKDSINYEQTIKDLKTEIKKFEKKIEKFETDNERLHQTNGGLRTENDSLIKKIKSLDSLNKSLKKENRDYKKDLDFYINNKDLVLVKNANDSLKLVIDTLKQDSINLNLMVANLKRDTNELHNKIDTLTTEKEKKEWSNVIKDPLIFGSSCVVIVAILISVTLISLKRGLTISKGNTSICIGEKKRTRTKKAD